MGKLFGLLVLIANIWAIYQIWTGRGDTDKKVIWTVVILLFPIIGLVLWLLMGRK